MMKTVWLAAALAMALPLGGCGLISFDVSEPVPEQTVPGSALGGLLPGALGSPFAVNINESQEEEAHKTGPASSADLKSITFTATSSGNFDFVSEMHIFIAPGAAGSSLPMVEIANSAPVPKGQTTLKLNVVPHVNLLPYIKAGSVISATASGTSPSSDFTYDGNVVITIHI